MKTTGAGKKVRLHFTPGGRVNEAKNLKTGATHSPADFAADRATAAKKGLGSGKANKKPAAPMGDMGMRATRAAAFEKTHGDQAF